MNALRSFPLLALPIVLYNLIVLLVPWSSDQTRACSEQYERAVHPIACDLQDALVELPMVSTLVVDEVEHKVYWALSLQDALLIVSLGLLFAELLKSTTIVSSSIVNHALSLIVFIIGLVEFLMFPAFATSVFFLITLMALLDVLAGFIVTIAAARRDVSLVS